MLSFSPRLAACISGALFATSLAFVPAAHADSVVKTLVSSDMDRTDVRSSIGSLKTKIKLKTPTAVPPTSGVFTSGYEMRWGVFHDGIDIANTAGTPIYAAKEGLVIDSGPAQGYGNWIRIKHADGKITLYGHMQALRVTQGQYVKAGEYIADMGNEGFSTGSHLHFGVYSAEDGSSMDPMIWLTQNNINLWG